MKRHRPKDHPATRRLCRVLFVSFATVSAVYTRRPCPGERAPVSHWVTDRRGFGTVFVLQNCRERSGLVPKQSGGQSLPTTSWRRPGFVSWIYGLRGRWRVVPREFGNGGPKSVESEKESEQMHRQGWDSQIQFQGCLIPS